MSRAFVKEQDQETPEVAVTPPAPAHPNFVTPAGLAQLRDRLAAAQAQGNERDVAALQERIARAQVVDLAAQPRDRVAFGARITVADDDGLEFVYRIVGEDEAVPVRGAVSWTSPLAQALLGARVGDVVTWTRPLGDLELEVRAIEYDDA